MKDKAIFQGTYSDLKFIKSRKVAQVVIEIPIEAASAFVKAFGTPDPAAEVPVAIAGLNSGKEIEQAAEEPELVKQPSAASPAHPRPHRELTELRLSQQAGLLCQDREFRAFLRSRQHEPMCWDVQGAAMFVREFCGVESRADIRPNTDAATRWIHLRDMFFRWKREQGDVILPQLRPRLAAAH